MRKKLVVLTGAGISAESGIKTFLLSFYPYTDYQQIFHLFLAYAIQKS
jgi:NAD-dependent SIR2 family protein deacetylase